MVARVLPRICERKRAYARIYVTLPDVDVAAPYRVFSRDLDVRVMIDLAGIDTPLSGREVASRIGASEAGVREALDRLVISGVVLRTPVGRSYAHSLNREHVATPAIEAMRAMRRSVIDAGREIIGRWAIAPVHASFFGSFARRDGDTSSDLDILLVHASDLLHDEGRVDRWEEQVAELEGLARLTGNRLQVLDLPETTLLEPTAEEEATLASIASDEVALTEARLEALMRRPRVSR